MQIISRHPKGFGRITHDLFSTSVRCGSGASARPLRPQPHRVSSFLQNVNRIRSFPDAGSLKKLLPGTAATPMSFTRNREKSTSSANPAVRHRADIAHDVIRPTRNKRLKPGNSQHTQQAIAAHADSARQVLNSRHPASRSATAPASCSGAGAPTVMKSCILRMAPVIPAGAMI